MCAVRQPSGEAGLPLESAQCDMMLIQGPLISLHFLQLFPLVQGSHRCISILRLFVFCINISSLKRHVYRELNTVKFRTMSLQTYIGSENFLFQSQDDLRSVTLTKKSQHWLVVQGRCFFTRPIKIQSISVSQS